MQVKLTILRRLVDRVEVRLDAQADPLCAAFWEESHTVPDHAIITILRWRVLTAGLIPSMPYLWPKLFNFGPLEQRVVVQCPTAHISPAMVSLLEEALGEAWPEHPEVTDAGMLEVVKALGVALCEDFRGAWERKCLRIQLEQMAADWALRNTVEETSVHDQ